MSGMIGRDPWGWNDGALQIFARVASRNVLA
jgi:hypothetical protein